MSTIADKHAKNMDVMADSKLAKINNVVLSFGSDHLENIHRLTSLCGELLGATCALYNCFDGGLLCSLSSWMPPADYNPKDSPDGHICYDVIRNGGNEVFVVRNLQSSKYARSDPNVLKYNLHTYIGKAVKFNGVYLGSLCVVYQTDLDPGEEEKQSLCLLASLIGIEEDRRLEYDKFIRAESRFQAFLGNQKDAICRWTQEMVLTFTNSAYNQLFGGEGKSLLGRRWIDFMPTSERAAFEDFYSHLITNPEVVTYEHKIMQADGKVRLFHWTDIPLLNGEGKLVEFQSIGRDITPRNKGNCFPEIIDSNTSSTIIR